MANTVIIHIGVPKTGSTAIQKFLYNNRSALQALGLDYHETHATDGENPDYWAHHLLAHKWGGWMNPETFPIDPDTAWEKLREDVMSGDDRTILISSERFADLLASKRVDEILDFIQTTLYPAQIKIFAYLRNQIVLTESFFKQQVKVGLRVPPINVYLQNRMPEFLDFLNMFENCAKLVGRENILLRTYESDLARDGNIIYSFVKALGIELPRDMIPESKKYNTSTSTLSTALLSHPNLRKIQHNNRFRKAIRQLFDDAGTVNGMEPSLLSAEQKKSIAEKYGTSNKILCERYANGTNEIRIDLENIKESTSLDDAQFVVTYEEVVKFLQVFSAVLPGPVKKEEK